MRIQLVKTLAPATFSRMVKKFTIELQAITKHYTSAYRIAHWIRKRVNGEGFFAVGKATERVQAQRKGDRKDIKWFRDIIIEQRAS
jgi:hypothetical protein